MPPVPHTRLHLTLEPAIPPTLLLNGLEAWLEHGLIEKLQWQWKNEPDAAWDSPSDSDSDHRLTLTAYQTNALLPGLDHWLHLGLLTDAQLRHLGSSQMSCPIPIAPLQTPASPSVPAANIHVKRTPVLTSASPVNLPRPQLPRPVQPTLPRSASPILHLVRSLFSEFSTLWLLFLGVFMVVVSSGLLAATQWHNFSAAGQYSLLLAYTLGFGGVSFWTSNQERLRLTTRALQLVTLLLVPANFWAMDGLGLLTTPLTLGLSAIAGLLLSAFSLFLFQTSAVFRDQQRHSTADSSRRSPPSVHRSQLTHLAILALSWLHLGWTSQPYRLIAVYAGIGSIAIVTYLNRRSRLNTADISTFPLATLAGTYGTGLLVARALVFGDVPIVQMGLAFGLCGWILCQLSAQLSHTTGRQSQPALSDTAQGTLSASPESANPFQLQVGWLLLGLGWLVSVWELYPWQTFVVSGLIAGLLLDRLRRFAHPLDLTYLFFWGLQILWLVHRLVPAGWQLQSTQHLMRLFQTQSEIALAGVGLFFYVVLTLVVAAFYRDRQQPRLASQAEFLALGLGGLLATLSSLSPITRIVNLTLSGLTLLVVQARRSSPSVDLSPLIYGAHLVSLGAIASALWHWGNVRALGTWAFVLLVIMLLEWVGVLTLETVKTEFSLSSSSPHFQSWERSAWHIGLAAAVGSYILLWYTAGLSGLSGLSGNSAAAHAHAAAGVAWLIVPVALTVLGSWSTFRDRDAAIQLSITALALAQCLTWPDPSARIIGLAVALGLMIVNTRRQPTTLAAALTTGCGLALIAVLLWQSQTGGPSNPTSRGVFALPAPLTFSITGVIISVMVLFGLSHWLKYRRDRAVPTLNLPLNQVYAQAFDGWAAALTTALLLGQSMVAISLFSPFGDSLTFLPAGLPWAETLFVNLLPSTVLVTLGLIYRTWQEADLSPEFWPQWGIAWGIELLATGVVVLTNGSLVELAIANLILGFLTQICGDWWMRRTASNHYPLSWDLVPLIYGVLGSLFRIGSFNDLSGFFTLSTALVAIGISRRASDHNPLFKALTYGSMAVATFSAYELLFYQMVSGGQGGSLGDGLVILAVLGCVLAYVYQLFSGWIMPYLKLSSREIDISAHLHWLASTVLVMSGTAFSPSRTGGQIGAGVAIALAAYAFWQGRTSLAVGDSGGTPSVARTLNPRSPSHWHKDLWVYIGLGVAIVAKLYIAEFAFPNPPLTTQVLRPYGAAIACGLAALLYYSPWERWGWSERPWHRSAFALPLVWIGLTAGAIAVPGLLIVATFYGIYAKLVGQIQISYLTLGLLDWAIFRGLGTANLPLLIYACVLGFSGFYFIHVEPSLQAPSLKSSRHLLRSFISGGICFIAWLSSFESPQMALVAWGLSLGFVIAGLAGRVRSYLFVGTIAFVGLVLVQAVTLVAQYSFLMWAIGIVAGIGFILVAANFEVRRDRILDLVRNLVNELDDWE